MTGSLIVELPAVKSSKSWMLIINLTDSQKNLVADTLEPEIQNKLEKFFLANNMQLFEYYKDWWMSQVRESSSLSIRSRRS